MNSKRELLFFIENYTGGHVDIKEMSHPKKHARTYINRFTINEDDQYDISKIEEMNTEWAFKEGQRPEHIQNRMNELVSGIWAESLDIFLFGWYEFKGKNDKRKSENQRNNQCIDIYNTLIKKRFHFDYVP